jgi:ferredoxin
MSILFILSSTPNPDPNLSFNPMIVGEVPKSDRLEGLNFDSTVALLGQYSDYDNVVITVKRVYTRGEVIIQMVGPQGEDAGNFTVLSGMGANLRTALNSQNIKLYDDRTTRFDSPYQTGSCGGEGTCGTCVVAVLKGAELMNERVRVEDGGLKQQLAPPTYRWSL